MNLKLLSSATSAVAAFLLLAQETSAADPMTTRIVRGMVAAPKKNRSLKHKSGGCPKSQDEAATQAVECGETYTGDVTLERILKCEPTTPLTTAIFLDGTTKPVTLDCQGKAIIGAGKAIDAFGDVTIENCVLTGFTFIGIEYDGLTSGNPAELKVYNTQIIGTGSCTTDSDCEAINIFQPNNNDVEIDGVFISGVGGDGITVADDLSFTPTSTISVKNSLVHAGLNGHEGIDVGAIAEAHIEMTTAFGGVIGIISNAALTTIDGINTYLNELVGIQLSSQVSASAGGGSKDDGGSVITNTESVFNGDGVALAANLYVLQGQVRLEGDNYFCKPESGLDVDNDGGSIFVIDQAICDDANSDPNDENICLEECDADDLRLPPSAS